MTEFENTYRENDTKPAQRSRDGAGMATSFGYETVETGEKQPKVDQVFHRVAGRYDLMNDLMSAGMHRIWKDAMVGKLALPKGQRPGWHCLDVAGGTGDIAFRIAQSSNPETQITVFDINSSMLEVGQQRAERQNLSDRLDFVEGNAESLPFQADQFDCYTIAFGIRNVPRIDLALEEAYRVLKPGGRFLCLEFSQVDTPFLDRLYHQWSKHGIPSVGKWVTGDRDSYQYLIESIAKFPNQEDFATMIRAAGFDRVRYDNFTGGVVALHSAWKL